jgi:hypothetical protein
VLVVRPCAEDFFGEAVLQELGNLLRLHREREYRAAMPAR